jgi:hypothetical protein
LLAGIARISFGNAKMTSNPFFHNLAVSFIPWFFIVRWTVGRVNVMVVRMLAGELSALFLFYSFI